MLESAERLQTLAKADSELTDEQFVQLEKDIFIGFYSIRKLMEAPGKVTDQVKETMLTLTWYPNIKRADSSNNHKLNKLYNLEAPASERRNIRFVCGVIIHSYIFTPLVNELGALSGIIFTSDRDKNKKLYTLSAMQVAGTFKRFGNDDVVSLVSIRNPETGDMEVHSAK